MFIFTRTEDDVIIETAQEVGRQSNGNYLLDPTGEPDMGRAAMSDTADITMYEVEEIPTGVEPEKYCYTEKDGFYKNPDYKEEYTTEQRLEALEQMMNEIILGEE